MTLDTILTLHPDPAKKGVNISQAKYDAVRRAILHTLEERGEMSFAELGRAVETALAGSFEGSVMWYYTTVKLDLEARGELQRVPGRRPQRVRLAAQA